MIFIKTIDYLANEMHKANPKYLREEYKYGLDIIFNTLGTVVLVIAISLILGLVKEAVIVLISFGVIRFFSGGKHLHTSIACMLTTALLIYLIIFIHLNIYFSDAMIYTLNIISLIIFSIFAPSNIEQAIKIKIDYKIMLKIISIAFVLISVVIHSELLTLTIFVQALTTIEIRNGVH